MNERLLFDNSAWARLAHPALPAVRLDEIADALDAGMLAVCLPFLLEAGYSARNARDYQSLLAELLSLPRFSIDEGVEQRAIDAQRQLARAGHHRLPPVDLLIAALAADNGVGVLHYDQDYDLLEEMTNLDFESVWLAPRGTL